MTAARRPELVIPASGTTSLPRLPKYVEHGGEIACRHPADAVGSRMYGFVLRADRDRLDEYCDRCFNSPTGGEEQWRAASDKVLLNFVDIPEMGSTDTQDVYLGATREQEAAIWFPVYEPRRNHLAWAIPYMFVDSGFALAGGREVYGFPKQLGTLKIPRGDVAPPELSLQAVTFKKFGRDSVATKQRVITVKRSGEPVSLSSAADSATAAREHMIAAVGTVVEPRLARGDVVGWLGDAIRDGGEFLADAIPHILFFVHLVQANAPMLLLKQFRDAHVPGAACYQALVLVDMTVRAFHAGGVLPGDYEITIPELDGEPIERELGVAASCPPEMAFWLDFDFDVDLGNVLWEAPVG